MTKDKVIEMLTEKYDETFEKDMAEASIAYNYARSLVEKIDEYSWEELKGIAVNVVGFICNLLDYDDVITVEKLKHIDNAEEIADAVIEEWQISI